MVWYHEGNFFWLFILIIVIVAAISRVIRSHQREKTIRAAIAKGVTLDPATLNYLQPNPTSTPQEARRGLLTGAIVTFFVGCGLGVMGFFLSLGGNVGVLHSMLAIGGLLWCISLGLFIAHLVIPRR